MNRAFFILSLLLLFSIAAFAQSGHSLSFNVTIDPALQENFKPDGRMFIFLGSDSLPEPRTQIWPNPMRRTYVFAKNISGIYPESGFTLSPDDSWSGTAEWSLEEVPRGTYYVQVLWDQDTKESRIGAPGNMYSKVLPVTIDSDQQVSLALNAELPDHIITEHPLARLVDQKSDTLSAWWGKDVHVMASVLLPHNYDATKTYPIRYNVSGYGGRYTRINNLLRDEGFMEWWDSENAPQVINVFLDGEGPYGDSYQMDSDNSGPYGYNLIHELIPMIENEYRGTTSNENRFVDGCSTGGWVSLGLQLYYPDVFDGVFSYSPDAIEFTNYQLINIYEDDNAYVNEFGIERPVMRDVLGEPMLTLRDFIQYENVLGVSDSYVTSGGQFSAHTALYSPKGEDGLPKPVFDPQSGVIDQEVAEYWKKYDFKLHVEENWEELGPKLEGKIYIWTGDMDNFYLNMATRAFDDALGNMRNPESDAVIEYTPMTGHCTNYSYRRVLEQIAEKL